MSFPQGQPTFSTGAAYILPYGVQNLKYLLSASLQKRFLDLWAPPKVQSIPLISIHVPGLAFNQKRLTLGVAPTNSLAKSVHFTVRCPPLPHPAFR